MDELENDEWAIVRCYLYPPKKDMPADELRHYLRIMDMPPPEGAEKYRQEFKEAAEIYLKYAEGKITETAVSDWEAERKRRRLIEVFEKVKEISEERRRNKDIK